MLIRDRSEPRETDAPPDRAPSRERKLKSLIRALAEDRVPDAVEVREIGREVALWREARFTLQRAWVARDRVAERYLLTNVSARPMVIEEPELFTDSVHAVSVENLHLAAGESTAVFIVRSRGARE